MQNINGLFGWVRHNDRRSIQLFVGFLAALHLLALPTLFVLLVVLDPAHAPFVAWSGYALRYVLPLTLIAFALFGVMTWWNLARVRRQLPIDYVWKATEPRLCRIAEPLLIAAGIPEPRLGVIESPAFNAFAYGLGAQSATLVVTRGLLDGLDDEELEAVIAHEITHIRNGDVRFMAAANAFLGCIQLLDRANTARIVTDEGAKGKSSISLFGLWAVVIVPVAFLIVMLQREERTEATVRVAKVAVSHAVGWAVLIAVLPFVVLPLLLLLFLRQQALNLGDLIRFLIASSREFIADAGAIELTRNPAALVAALRRIEGRNGLDAVPADCHAMMIAGDSDGEGATHPSMRDRIGAIVATTGGMAMIGSSRRDSRPSAVRGFGRRGVEMPTFDDFVPRQQVTLLRQWLRIATRDAKAMFGIGTPHLLGMVFGIIALISFNADAIAQPAKIIAKFDPRPSSGIVTAMRISAQCTLNIGRTDDRSLCSSDGMAAAFAGHAGEDNIIGTLARQMLTASANEEAIDLAGAPDSRAGEIARRNCFNGPREPTYRQSGFAVLDEDVSGVTIDQYTGWIGRSARDVSTAENGARAEALKTYLDERLGSMSLIYAYWGPDGWAKAVSALDDDINRKALSILKEELGNHRVVELLGPVQVAEARVVLAAPNEAKLCYMVAQASG